MQVEILSQNPLLQKLYNLFSANNYELYIVGGAVRDIVLKQPPKDYDLITNTSVPNMTNLLLANKYNIYKSNNKNNIITVISPDKNIQNNCDITSFTQNDPNATIISDIFKRDLTINALYYDFKKKNIVDLIGGIHDLQNKIIKSVGDSEIRFLEDGVRPLRVIRFTCVLNGTVDKGLQNALCVSNYTLVSAERVKNEFCKSVQVVPVISKYIQMLEQYNLLQQVFSKNLVVTSKVYIEERDLNILVAFILHQNKVDNIKKVLTELKWSNQEITVITFLVSLKDLRVENSYSFKKCQINANINGEVIKKYAKWVRLDAHLIGCFVRFELTVNGNEILLFNIKGRDVGRIIENQEVENFRYMYEKKNSNILNVN